MLIFRGFEYSGGRVFYGIAGMTCRCREGTLEEVIRILDMARITWEFLLWMFE